MSPPMMPLPSWLLNPASTSSCRSKRHSRGSFARCAKAGVEIHGAYGLSDEFPVERLYRDCMAPIIYGGTANVHKLVLGRLELGIDAVSR